MAVTTRALPERELIEGPKPPRERRVAAQLEKGALAATSVLPFPLLVYLGLNSGGYSRGIAAVAAAIMGGLLLLRCIVAPRTVRRPGWIGSAALAALFAFGAWQLLSAGWSESATRSIAEFDRTALYLLAFLTFTTLPRRSLRPVLMAVGAAIAVLTLIGLATRVRPDLFPIEQPRSPQRLSYPLTYWNAMGVMIALGLVICLHFASELHGRFTRVLGAALFPALAVALFFTLSRGGMAIAIGALAMFVVLAHPRGLVPALLAIALPTGFALLQAYEATALISETPTTGEAISQGKDVATAVLFCCFVAGFARGFLAVFDEWLRALRLPTIPKGARPAVLAAVAVALFVGGVAAGGPAFVNEQYDRFVSDAPDAPTRGDARKRLTQVYNAGRIDHWRLALDSSADHRTRGLGAGTFDQQWYRDRPDPSQVTEAHNLYVETLSELGYVGLALLAVFLACLLAAVFSRRRRWTAAAAAGTVIVAWALHAAIDWDWEMPAVTLIPILLAAVASSVPARRSGKRLRWTPGVVAVAAVAVAVVPTMSALAETDITEAQRAYVNRDCAQVDAKANSAKSLLPMLPEPHALLALCALRADKPDVARREARRAVATDPNDWEWRYLNALVIGSTGKDPRPELRRARELNPRGVAPSAFRKVLAETPRPLWPIRSVQAYVWMRGSAYAAIRPE